MLTVWMAKSATVLLINPKLVIILLKTDKHNR